MIDYILAFSMKISKLMSRKNLYAWLQQKIALTCDSREIKVLNVGASGAIPDLLKKAGTFDFFSLDINPEKNPDIVCDVCNMKGVIEDNTYDVIVMMEVLEHIPDPSMAMAELKRILKPGGMLLGSTPFLFPIHDAPHDYYRYTIYGLKHLLREYTNVAIQPRNSYGEAVAVLLSRLVVSGSVRERLMGLAGLFLAMILYPVVFILGKLCHQNLGPTGYVWSATKV